VSDTAPQESRTFLAPDGARWEARIIARGRSSPYLAPKVGRPTLQFTRLDPPAGSPRYAPLPGPGLDDLSDEALVALWLRARIY
jgi:hypothetical protein